MKTVVSLPDNLFRAADALARDLGISRTTAVAEYLARRRDEHIAALLDQVYRDQSGGLAPELRHAQGSSLAADEW